MSIAAVVSRGVVNSVEANVRRVAELALKHRASSVIMAHNHPDGLARPSREDDYVTKQIYSALNVLGIPLVDHIVVSDKTYVSYSDTGLLELYRY